MIHLNKELLEPLIEYKTCMHDSRNKIQFSEISDVEISN